MTFEQGAAINVAYSTAYQALFQRGRALPGEVVFVNGATEKEKSEIHAALAAGLGNGSLQPVVGRTFSLAEAPQAHIQVMTPGAYGKIVLVP